jgi:hypothetical protein
MFLVLLFLIWILGSCRKFCEERCCIEMIEMKGGILFMENCDLYCISFLLSCFLNFCLDFLKVRIHSFFNVKYYSFLSLVFSIHFFGK